MADQLKNGKQILLWVNTALTTIVLAGGGWVAARFWDRVDSTRETTIRTEENIKTVQRDIATIQIRLDNLEKSRPTKQ